MLKASIVITSKNRKDELRTALRSCLLQNGSPEVIVIDDGSTDGTSEMVRSEFPSVRIESPVESRGYIVQRNWAASLAKGDVIISIDDDAEFSSPKIVEQTLVDISTDSRIGAVAIPFIEPGKANIMMQTAPDNDRVWVTDTFKGTSYAVRRDLFLKLGGFREKLFHQGEESDLSIRMLNLGYFVGLGKGDHIVHNESPKRYSLRMDYYGVRNSVLFAWQNTPLLFLPFHLIATTWNCMSLTFDPLRFWNRFKGLIAGYWMFHLFTRTPVSSRTYRLFRYLRTSHACTYEEAENLVD